ncbi:MAG: hypothetical protein ACRCS8_02970 [Brevinema sp.]
MKKNWIYALLLLSPISLFSVETKFIHSKNFENIWLWQLSNTSVQPEQYISLPNESQNLLRSKDLFWTAEKINNQFYIGTGESAKILKISANFSKQEEIYSNPDKTLVGAIKSFENGLLVGLSPESELVQFNQNHQVITNIALSNTYIWDIVPTSKTHAYVLAGMPAEIYEYSGKTLTHVLSLSNEEHLIHGIYQGGSLWVLGETALYEVKNNKAIAIASFDGTASSFIYHKNKFYVIMSENIKNPEDPKSDIVNSTLLSVSKDGVVERLYVTKGFYFTGIGAQKDHIVMGGDQFGFYARYDLVTKKTELASLGAGKIIEIFNHNNNLLFMTADESGFWTVGNVLAREGSFISEVYDTGNASSWGRFQANISTPPNTEIKFFIQSGVTKDPDLWRDWQEVKIGQNIPTPKARFIRYKAVLTSDTKAKPYVYEVKFPYTQQNLAPIFDNVTITQSNRDTLVGWVARDPNNDILEFDIYLAEDGMDKIKITPKPVQGTNFLIMNEMFPSGYKRITLVASDKPSNTPKDALTTEYHSIPVLIDSEGPRINPITINKRSKKASVSATDEFSIIKQMLVVIDGADPISILPKDGIFDDTREEFEFDVPVNKTTFIQVHITDAAGNTSTRGTTITP